MRNGLAFALLLALAGGCRGGDADPLTAEERARGLVAVTVATKSGTRLIKAELADTEPEQATGLMFRTSLPDDGGMLFRPYPPTGGPPEPASFWMQNTPLPLDIIFIRPDGTIARIAAETVPMSETPIESGEPVGAVLEIRGGRAAAMGIAEGDRITLPPVAGGGAAG